jgi:hypothetical protein
VRRAWAGHRAGYLKTRLHCPDLAQIAERLWPRIFARLGELAMGGSDVPPAAQIRAAEMVHARLPEPEKPERKEGTSARQMLAELLARRAAALPRCQHCGTAVGEADKYCKLRSTDSWRGGH